MVILTPVIGNPPVATGQPGLRDRSEPNNVSSKIGVILLAGIARRRELTGALRTPAARPTTEVGLSSCSGGGC